MGAAETIPRVSFEQFLLLLELSHTKLEWLDGIAYAMAGGSFEHSRLANRVGTILTNALHGQRCVALQSDMLVKAPAEGFAAFPDASVVCDEPIMVMHEKNPALTNPAVIIEVLSSSTEDYDRGEKLSHYKQLPSLQAVLVVSHQQRRVTLHAREPDGWGTREFRSQETFTVPGVEVQLGVDGLYGSLVR